MGQRIDKYEVERELGSGAMGQVLLARDTVLGRRVALKLLRISDPRALRRFAVEAETVARLNHPNLVKLHEAVLTGPRPYLVLSYVEGETLEQRLERRGRLEPAEAIDVTLQLCAGLEHAHAHGVLHRDVKPSNVLVDRDGRPRLSDFGLARDLDRGSLEDLTRTGQIVGTPAFMAPEQATGDRGALGPATDVYGIGATLYALLAGRAPHERSNMMALVAAVTNEAPARLRTLVPDLDPSLERIVHACLAKRPADRFPTPAALAEALRTGRAPPRGVPGLWLVGAAGLALAVGLAALAGRPRPAPPPATAARPSPARRAVPPPARAALPVDEKAWRRATLRMSDDPRKAWAELADVTGPLPERDVVQGLLDQIERRLPAVLRAAQHGDSDLEEELLACLRLLRRLEAPAVLNHWVIQLLEHQLRSRWPRPLIQEAIGLTRGHETPQLAQALLSYVSAVPNPEPWLPTCLQLAARLAPWHPETPRAWGLLATTLARPAPLWVPWPARRHETERVLAFGYRAWRTRGAIHRKLAIELSMAHLRLDEPLHAYATATHGWRLHRSRECEALRALSLLRLGLTASFHDAALTFLRLGAPGTASLERRLWFHLLGHLWDATPRPDLREQLLRLARARHHTWEARLVLLYHQRGQADLARLRLEELKSGIRYVRRRVNATCTCRREHHQQLLALPREPGPELAALVEAFDRERRQSASGFP